MVGNKKNKAWINCLVGFQFGMFEYIKTVLLYRVSQKNIKTIENDLQGA